MNKLHKRLDELKQHKRFDECIEYTQYISSLNKKAPNILIHPRKVTQFDDGTAHVLGAFYEKNFSYDFQLSSSKVKRIKNDKYTNEDLNDLEDDLNMLDNNPDYNQDIEYPF